MRAAPETGWLCMDRTMQHLQSIGRWDGDPATRKQAWEDYWKTSPGSNWRQYGFMCGNVNWFYGAPQETLATQGNEYFNSTEGRLIVAIDRYRRGFTSNITEVLFFMDLWSMRQDKIKLYEVDGDANQTISFATLKRNEHGFIEAVQIDDRRYAFEVDDQGVVTAVQEALEP